MIKLRLDHEPDGRAIMETPDTFNPRVNHVFATVRGEKLLGGVTFEKYTGKSISMHVRSFDKHWLTRDLLWIIFHYPFVQLGCNKVLGFVPSSNQKALAFDLKIGFKEEHRIRDACPGGDLVVLSMTKEECRWLAIEPKGVGVKQI